MDKIQFVNGTIPALSAENLNKMQDNIERAINGIFESGSNANGRYIKFKDGTMICWKKVIKDLELNHAWGSFYENSPACDLGNFAQTFITTPVVNVNVVYNDGDTSIAAFVECYQPTATGVSKCFIVRPMITDTASYTFDIQAIGRWY